MFQRQLNALLINDFVYYFIIQMEDAARFINAENNEEYKMDPVKKPLLGKRGRNSDDEFQ